MPGPNSLPDDIPDPVERHRYELRLKTEWMSDRILEYFPGQETKIEGMLSNSMLDDMELYELVGQVYDALFAVDGEDTDITQELPVFNVLPVVVETVMYETPGLTDQITPWEGGSLSSFDILRHPEQFAAARDEVLKEEKIRQELKGLFGMENG